MQPYRQDRKAKHLKPAAHVFGQSHVCNVGQLRQQLAQHVLQREVLLAERDASEVHCFDYRCECPGIGRWLQLQRCVVQTELRTEDVAPVAADLAAWKNRRQLSVRTPAMMCQSSTIWQNHDALRRCA